ncbi:MAG: efflux transporter outer membrane subunit [Alphaproteobacteria bacterium]|nr:efflux transporter outer membrane subunit [Alphaproteobacteria bacterium]
MIDKKTFLRASSAGVLATFAAGCGHLPIAKPAFEAMETQRAGMPTDWTVAPMTGDASSVLADYSVFGDKQLSAYIQEALENNRTLRATMENVNQSRALLKQTKAGLWPSLKASVGATESRPTNDFGNESDLYTFGVTGAYSVDIMGSLDASVRASAAGLRSTEATYELARRQLAATVARAYFAVIEQRQQLDLTRRTLARAQDTFRITQTRFDAGAVARDELVLGQSSLASSEASIIAQEASVRSAIRALESALGRFPQQKAQVATDLPATPPSPPLGLPELTIRARPDVVAAEYNLIQTFGNTRVVHLTPWPQLNANLGLALNNTTTTSTSGLFDFDNLAFTIGATLAQTIFDGGAIQGRIEAADAQQRSALERYGQTVIDAYGNIVSAIDALNTLQARDKSLQTASDAAKESLRLAELRYNEGSQSLLDLISVRDRADSAESQLIANRRSILEQWIVLHLALGGDPTKPTPLATLAATAEGAKKK